jgi:hypothetical protein
LTRTVKPKIEKLIRELAALRKKDDEWIRKQISNHLFSLIADAHHGYTDKEKIFLLEEEIAIYKQKSNRISEGKGNR